MIFNSDKRKKIKFYKDTIENTKRKIWHKEFLLSQLRHIREGIRRQYDRLREETEIQEQYRDLINAYGLDKARELTMEGPEKCQSALQDKPKNPPALSEDAQEIVKTLDKQITEKKTDIEYMKSQLSGIDHQIEETHVSANDGGIVGVIAGFKNAIELLKAEIKKQ